MAKYYGDKKGGKRMGASEQACMPQKEKVWNVGQISNNLRGYEDDMASIDRQAKHSNKQVRK